MSILIVDDSKSQRLLLSSMMKSAGFANLVEATSAVEAFQRLGMGAADTPRARDIDLILMDLSMPEINGIEACRRIKEEAELHDIPLIIITASTELDDLQLAFDAGALDYITKPPNKVDLLARVGSALRLKTATDIRKEREMQLIEYLEQVSFVTAAAAAVETKTFSPESLDAVAKRPDELGKLARVFQRMAREVIQREQRLMEQLNQLSVEVNEAKKSRAVAEITETDYFQELQKKVKSFRAKPSAKK